MAAAKFIEKHLSCSICQEEFKNPRRLICGHIYCLKCLQSHINATAGERYIRRGTVMMTGFNCPECRRPIRIPRPWESKDGWALQINADFKTANIQADLREGEYIVLDPSDKKAEEGVHEISSKVSKVQVRMEPTQDREQSKHRHMETETTNTAQIEKEPVSTEQIQTNPTKKTKLAVKGKLMRVISPKVGDKPSEVYDLVVLVQGDNRIMVTLDFQMHKIITLTLNKDMEVIKSDSHCLGCKPWRICKVSRNQVAVTVSEPEGVLMCSIDSVITVERLFQSRKHYDGIALLTEGKFVLTTNDNVDIVKNDGSVLQEFKVSAPHVKYSDNSYVACTANQNIVVTDCGGKTVSCVTQEGKIAWRKKMNPLGVACDSDVYFVDCEAEVVYQFTNRGRFVCKVVEKSESFCKPSGVAVDGTGFMYVICNFKDITVWKLCPPEDTGL